MAKSKQSKSAEEFTRLILSVFGLNGALLIAGDRLTAPIGLTSARWQVLGTIADSPMPMTVAGIAKSIGSSRQNIRIIVRELEAAGMVTLTANPNHQRASLVKMTKSGQQATDSAQALQIPFAESVSAGIPASRLADSSELLQVLLTRLRSHQQEAKSVLH